MICLTSLSHAVFEQLPLSKNDSIKVKLIEPSSDDLASKKSNVILNEFNNLRWVIRDHSCGFF